MSNVGRTSYYHKIVGPDFRTCDFRTPNSYFLNTASEQIFRAVAQWRSKTESRTVFYVY
jgi:hypothetical protein